MAINNKEFFIGVNSMYESLAGTKVYFDKTVFQRIPTCNYNDEICGCCSKGCWAHEDRLKEIESNMLAISPYLSPTALKAYTGKGIKGLFRYVTDDHDAPGYEGVPTHESLVVKGGGNYPNDPEKGCIMLSKAVDGKVGCAIHKWSNKHRPGSHYANFKPLGCSLYPLAIQKFRDGVKIRLSKWGHTPCSCGIKGMQRKHITEDFAISKYFDELNTLLDINKDQLSQMVEYFHQPEKDDMLNNELVDHMKFTDEIKGFPKLRTIPFKNIPTGNIDNFNLLFLEHLLNEKIDVSDGTQDAKIHTTLLEGIQKGYLHPSFFREYYGYLYLNIPKEKLINSPAHYVKPVRKPKKMKEISMEYYLEHRDEFVSKVEAYAPFDQFFNTRSASDMKNKLFYNILKEGAAYTRENLEILAQSLQMEAPKDFKYWVRGDYVKYGWIIVHGTTEEGVSFTLIPVGGWDGVHVPEGKMDYKLYKSIKRSEKNVKEVVDD